jgi:hypothetical protein
MTPKSKIEYARAVATAALAHHATAKTTVAQTVADAVTYGRAEAGREALAYELGIRAYQTECLERELQRVLDILTAK